MNKVQQYKELKQIISEKSKELKIRIKRLLKNIEIIDIKEIILDKVIDYEIETKNWLEQLYEVIYPEGYYSD